MDPIALYPRAMRNVRRSILSTALLGLAALAAVPAFADERTFGAEYSVRLTGIKIGVTTLKARFGEADYTLRFTGASSPLMRLFADTKISASSTGRLTKAGLAPSAYEHRWAEKDDVESAAIGFEDGVAAHVRVEPPIDEPRRYVPVTEEHKRGVADPLGAFFWPEATEATPDICRRTIPVFDGLRRFDFELSFGRSDTYTAADGSFAGGAVVCKVRYRPVSGHRRKPNRKSFMPADKDIEIWMARLPSGLVMPVRVAIPSRFGLLRLDALKVETSASP